MCCALLWLAACQQPTTHTPNITPEEIEAERAMQEAAASKHQEQQTRERNEHFGAMQARLRKVALPIIRAGSDLCEQMTPPGSYCVYEVVLDQQTADERADIGVNAYADGQKIVVGSGMMHFAKTDEELALVISHEYAHNIMGHVSSQQLNTMAGSILGLVVDVAIASQGYSSEGAFQNIGSSMGQLSYSAEFESEADYVGLYIMARAGFRIERAADFWRRMGGLNPESITHGQTHPTTPERFIGVQKTIEEIRYKRAHNMPLLPDFRPEN